MKDTLIGHSTYIKLNQWAPCPINLKIESLNIAGSIKLKTAESLIYDAEVRGFLRAGASIIESSSGNLGVALAAVCARRGYKFTCVVDPNASPSNVAFMRALGATVVEIDRVDENGGYLGSRIQYVKEYISSHPEAYWTNQYANPANPLAHEVHTAREIINEFPNIDLLVVGAGTTGTLMGCISFFSKHRPGTHILAVDSVGSITFGSSGKRCIPGLGTSRIPEIFNRSLVLDHILVPESETVAMCRRLARTEGYLAGGSTGTVLAGLMARSHLLTKEATVVAISPDGGEKYLDTIYDDHWVAKNLGLDLKA